MRTTAPLERALLAALPTLLLPLLSLPSAGIGAQEVERARTVRVQGEEASVRSAAWLGVHLLNEWAVGPGGRSFTMRVERVADGSPAQAAGIRPGDRIVRVNGRPASHQGLNRVMAGLRPGERIDLVLDRDGWSRDVALTAARRPTERVVVMSRELALRIDSTMQRLDSIRVALHPVGAGLHGGPRVRAAPTGDGRMATIMLRPGVAERDTTRTRFSAIVEAVGSSHPGEAPPAPLLPFIVGRNRVAGAALIPVDEGLGSYFDVEAGLLVTEVTPGTPADDVGITPGDVVVRVDGRPVRTLDDLRTALWRTAHGPLALDLVRKSRPVQVTLQR